MLALIFIGSFASRNYLTALFYDVKTDKEQSVGSTTLEFIAANLKQWSILSYLSVMLLRSLHSKSQCLNEGQCQPIFHQDSVR